MFNDELIKDRYRPDPEDPAKERQRREQWIEAIRRRVRQPPRNMGMRAWFGTWAVPSPPWLKSNDPLRLFFKERHRLLREGVVVWGAIVQANQLLFENHAIDAPCEVVYCPDVEASVDPEWLLEAASDLFALKSQVDLDSELQPIADHLTDETTRSFGRNVPRSYIREHPLALTTMLLFRKHVPGKKLTGRLLPILITQDAPRVAMVVPFRMWPIAMRKAYPRNEL